MIFLSTPSARRATKRRLSDVLVSEISIHALREEGDKRRLSDVLVSEISIHALREEGDPACISCRGSQRRISIHALREEGDLMLCLEACVVILFLSTPSARRATPCSFGMRSCPGYFYPRPPRGGRLYRFHASLSSRIFLSTPSARRATCDTQSALHPCRYFYPRPPRGGRRRQNRALRRRNRHFYPRPPRGGRRPDAPQPPIDDLFLSTPSARRATSTCDAALHLLQFLSTPSARRAT